MLPLSFHVTKLPHHSNARRSFSCASMWGFHRCWPSISECLWMFCIFPISPQFQSDDALHIVECGLLNNKKWEENIGDDDNFKWGSLAVYANIYILCVRLKFSLLLLALAWNRERSLLLIIGSAIPPLYLNISFEIDFENCSSWLSAGSCFKLFGVCFFSPPPRIIIIIIIVLG